jgi:DNA-binding winged helix-turn-helix (wHTH) protein
MKFQFGDVRVDADARLVWRGTQVVHLPRKAFELLLLLLEQRPNAVSKEHIHSRLWPDTYVSESSVQALISDIRQAIGDDGRRRAMLRTVHGVGYAFSAEAVEEREATTTGREAVRAWLVGDAKRHFNESDDVGAHSARTGGVARRRR